MLEKIQVLPKKILLKGTNSFPKLTLVLMTLLALLKSTLTDGSGPYPLKIQTDISRLWPIKHGYEKGDQLYDRLVLTIIPAVVKHLEDTFAAYDIQTMTMNDTPCNNLDVSKYKNVVIDGNMVLIFNYEDKVAGYTAYAGVCKISSTNMRPLVSYIMINLRNTNLIDKAYTEKTFTTLLHEAHHGLGFLSGYLPYFYDRTSNSTRPTSEVYTSSSDYSVRILRPQVVDWAKEHFDCNTLTSVPLENLNSSGSGNSHYEKYILGNEMMNPSAFYNLKYSGASIGYIESMEFFSVQEPKTKMQEVLAWGYKAGCSVLNDDLSCSDNPMVCQKTGSVCSADYYSIGTCNVTHSSTGADTAAGGCQVFQEKLDCRYQNKLGTRCVEIEESSGYNNATCSEISCSDAGSGNFNVQITLPSGDTLTCNNGEGGTKKTIGSSGDNLVCPDPNLICRKGLICPNDCSNQGRCKSDGTCWCFPDFTGEDCSQVNPDPYRMNVLDWQSHSLLSLWFLITISSTLMLY